MELRKACSADLDGVEAIYDALLTLEEQGVGCTNWQRGVYPTRGDAQAALDAGTLYVGVVDGTVAAAVILNHVQLPEYAAVDWTIPAEGEQALVIHTLVIHPQRAGRGLGQRCVAFAEELGRSLGCKAVRLDTYEGNLPAASLYRKLGYRYAGKTLFNFHGIVENLILFEKAL